MGKLNIKPGSTDVTVYVSISDSASTTGGKKTGIVYNAAGLTAYYTRTRGTATAITLATLAAADSAHSDGGFKEVDATNAPGLYRLDLPDAVVAVGVRNAVVTLKGAAGMVQCDLEIDLASETDNYAWNGVTTPMAALTTGGVAALSTAQIGGLSSAGTATLSLAQLKVDGGAQRAVEIKSASKEAIYLEGAGNEPTLYVKNTGTAAGARFSAAAGIGLSADGPTAGMSAVGETRGFLMQGTTVGGGIGLETVGGAIGGQSLTGSNVALTGTVDANVVNWKGTAVDASLTATSVPAITAAQMTTTQLGGLPTQTVSSLTTADITALTTADIDALITANTFIGEIRDNTFTSLAEEAYARAFQQETADVLTAVGLDGSLPNNATTRVLLATESITLKGVSINPSAADADIGVITSDGVTNTWTPDAGWTGALGPDLYLVVESTLETAATVIFTAKRLQSGTVPEDITYEMVLKPGGNYQTWGTENVARGLYNCTGVSAGASGGSGSGSVQYTDTVVNQTTGLPLADVHVWVTTDVGGDNIVGSDYTDAFGVFTLNLDPGSYYLWQHKDGFDFTNPITITVVAP